MAISLYLETVASRVVHPSSYPKPIPDKNTRLLWNMWVLPVHLILIFLGAGINPYPPIPEFWSGMSRVYFKLLQPQPWGALSEVPSLSQIKESKLLLKSISSHPCSCWKVFQSSFWSWRCSQGTVCTYEQRLQHSQLGESEGEWDLVHLVRVWFYWMMGIQS